MPDTFIKIASVTVGSGGASSIDFTSIPSTYTDLVIKVSARQSDTNANFSYFAFNGSTANFNMRTLEGNGSSVVSAAFGNSAFGISTVSNFTADTFSNIEAYIPNYAGSNNKSYSSDAVTENNATTSFQDIIAGLWSQTTAINRITIYPASNNFVQHTTATLYGISKS